MSQSSTGQLTATLHLYRQQDHLNNLIMNSIASNAVFASLNYLHPNTQSSDNLNSRLPLKKRLIREMTPYSRISAPTALWPLVPTSLPVVRASDEANFKPISPSSFSSCSSASMVSETSLDSGFGDIEPLDLSCNSTILSKNKPLQASTSSSPRSNNASSPKQDLMCPECGKMYESNSRFRAHLRRHESKLSGRYRCGVCFKNFVQRSSLKTHERIHTGERPYHCQLCDQRFGDFSTFTKHRRTHTGEKPYSCPECGLSFSQSGNRNRHMKVHSHVNPYNSLVSIKHLH